ncbi:ganglioside GM2 activator-like [Oscarella lobularis]|uniref:ganglioside GM2 activator-like n=1 Tax=Oscarella lobularis TaxID=121494 RepID=UPI0033138B8A
MARVGLIVALFALSFALLGARLATREETLSALLDLLSLPQPLSRTYKDDRLGFDYSNCGSASDPIVIHNASLTDPIPIPGTIKFSVNFTFGVALESPLKADLSIKKKVLGLYVPIPCLDNIGSCTYDDVCALIPSTSECPPPLSTYNIPCQCPFKAASYGIPPYSLDIPEISLPSFLTNGEYELQATLTMANGQRAACYQAHLSIEAS